MSVLSSSISRSKFSFLDDRYTDIKKIGFGGMGYVYSAFDRFLNKKVAIKVLGSNNASDEQLIRFQKEAKLTSRLSHPNIVKVIDFGVSPTNDLYLIMDQVEGRSLKEKLDEDGPLSIEEAVHISYQICAGLSHAHKRGIIHRDIKPSNIMLDESCSWMIQAKIVDFGLAKLESEDKGFISSGKSMLTPLYSSPEQISNQELDSRTDIYSLGCVMYEMLIGEPPYKGASTLDTFDMHLNFESPRLSNDAKCSGIPVEMEQIVHKSMMKDSASRYQCVEDIRIALEDVPVYVDCGITHEASIELETEPNVTLYPMNYKLAVYAISMLVFSLAALGAFFVTLEDSPKQKAPVTVLMELPFSEVNSGSFYKSKKNGLVIWVGSGEISDVNMKSLKKATVQILRFQGMVLSKGDLECLSDMSISRLLIEDSYLDNSYTQPIGTLKNLRHLDLSYSNISDEGLASIGRLENLDTLIVTGCVNITSKSTPVILNSFPNVRNLNLDYCGIDGSGISGLAKLSKLQGVSAKRLDLEDKNIEELVSNDRLILLDVSDNKSLTDKCLEYLGSSKSIKFASIRKNPEISHQALKNFEKHNPSIEWLKDDIKIKIDSAELTEIVTGIIDYSK